MVAEDKIKHLTKHQKLLLLDVLKEKTRRKKLKKDTYTPNKGQRQVHACDKRLRFVFSGNGSGKSSLMVNEVYWAATGYNPVLNTFTKVPATVAVVLDKPEKISQQFLPELIKWHDISPEQFYKCGKPFISEIRFDNGSVIRFFFHGQEPLAFEGIEVDFVAFDEPAPQKIFQGLLRGGRKKGRVARYLLVGTPISAAYLRTDIYEPWSRGELPDTECFRFGTVVNKQNLADNYIEDFGRYLSDKEKKIRFQGEFFDLEGLALAHLFKEETHTVPRRAWDPNLPVVIAIDPHTSKPNTAVVVAADREDDLYVLEEISLKATARDFARWLKANWLNKYRVMDIIGDSAGKAEMTGGESFKSFFQILHEEGIRIRETSYNDKLDEDFIARIQGVLEINPETGKPKLRIFEDLKGIQSDIRNVQWIKLRNEDINKPKLDIRNKDFLAALKYALAANITLKKKKTRAYYPKTGMTNYGQQKNATMKWVRNKYKPKGR